MATVFLARLRGPFGFSRPVAIKRLHPPYAKDARFVSMILDEARLCTFVRHPNVVQVLDLVAHEGELWLVLEHVLGASLREIASLAPGPMPPAIARSIMRDVLQGLHAAHEARGSSGEHLGLVHRDVSPHNVLLGADGIARVADFGIAKAMWRVQSTASGQLKGKLAYMSPEQLGAGPVDRRSDLYAASILFWELLTGERLFESCEPADVLARDAHVVEPPSSRRAELPAELDAVVLRGLQATPANRYDTALDMLEALVRDGAGNRAELASRQEVAAWLQARAPELLAEREAALHRPTVEGARADSTQAVAAPWPADEDTYIESTGPGQRVGRAGPGARFGRAWSFGVVGLGAAALVLLGSTGLHALLNRSSSSDGGADAPSAAQTSAQAAAPRLEVSTLSSPDGPPSSPRLDLEPPAAPTERSASGSKARPSQADPRPVTGPKPGRTEAPPRPRDPCDPPYVIDDEGIRRFKEQCL